MLFVFPRVIKKNQIKNNVGIHFGMEEIVPRGRGEERGWQGVERGREKEAARGEEGKRPESGGLSVALLGPSFLPSLSLALDEFFFSFKEAHAFLFFR